MRKKIFNNFYADVDMIGKQFMRVSMFGSS